MDDSNGKSTQNEVDIVSRHLMADIDETKRKEIKETLRSTSNYLEPMKMHLCSPPLREKSFGHTICTTMQVETVEKLERPLRVNGCRVIMESAPDLTSKLSFSPL
jgi:hypothetical protein